MRVHTPGAERGSFAPLACRVLTDVLPGPDELLIAIGPEHRPSARLRGRLVDSAARPMSARRLKLSYLGSREGDGLSTSADDATFASELLSPGTYQLRASFDGYPETVLGSWTLRAGEERDVGTLRLPDPNRLVVTLAVDDGSALQDARVFLGPDPLPWRSFRFLRPSSDAAGVWRSGPLLDGTYVLNVLSFNAAPLRTTIEVTGGGETLARITCERGHARDLVVSFPEYVAGQSDARALNVGHIDLSVRDASGATVLSDRWSKRFEDAAGRRARFELRLAAGDYTVVVSQARQQDRAGESVQLELSFGPQHDGAVAIDLR